MTREFWQERWRANQIGFHEGSPNAQLVATWEQLGVAPNGRVLVPLAGKAMDLAWLAERGHEVVGVELVLEAIEAFFLDRGLEAAAHRGKVGRHDAYSVGGVSLVHADALEVKPEDLGVFDAVYDRAALVALDPALRSAYVESCARLLAPTAPTLLIAFSHDADVGGPPWSVDEATVRALHSPRKVDVLDRRDGPVSPRLAAAGLASMVETAYRVGPTEAAPEGG